MFSFSFYNICFNVFAVFVLASSLVFGASGLGVSLALALSNVVLV